MKAAEGAPLIRQLNRQAVLTILKTEGAKSRAELAVATGLAKPTVSSIVADLLAEAVVYESGRKTGARGRPSILLEFNNLSQQFGAVAVEDRAVTAAIVDALAVVQAEVTVELPHADGLVGAVAEALQLACDAVPTSPQALDSIVVACPETGGGAGAKRPVRRADPRDRLAEQVRRLLGPAVSMVEPAHACVVAETTSGRAEGAANAVVLDVTETTLQCGLLLDGHLYRGVSGAAGQVGVCALPPGAQHSTIGELVAADTGIQSLADPAAWLIHMVDPDALVVRGAFGDVSFGEIEQLRGAIVDRCQGRGGNQPLIIITGSTHETVLQGAGLIAINNSLAVP